MSESGAECWPLGVTLEQRKVSRGLWEADSWQATGVESCRQEGQGAQALHCERRSGEAGVTLWTWRPLLLELYRDERAAYRFNLDAGDPRLFVICNEDDAGVMRPLLLTASQDVAASYMDGGEEDVFSVPMPTAIQCWIEAFIARHGEPDLGLSKGKRRRYRGARKAESSHG